MKLEQNHPCPCKSGKKYKRCCGLDAETKEIVRAAIHELGHVSALPLETDAHVSLLNPCHLCVGDEGFHVSTAHTSYREGNLDALDEIIYSLAGGAAEAACGLSPSRDVGELGSLPASMGVDIADLRKALDAHSSGIWEALRPQAPKCFNVIVSHFEQHAEFLWRSSRSLREMKVLESHDVDWKQINREKLLITVKRALRLDV